MQNNVLDYLTDTVKRLPEKKAFCGRQSEYTFSEVYEYSRKIGTYIARLDIRKKPVIVYMKKSPEEILAFYGIIFSGCYYVPIDSEMPRSRMLHILENTGAQLMICDKENREMAEKLGFSGRIVDFDEAAGCDTDEELLDEIKQRTIDTDPIYIVFTSGSTGVPKGVCACHRSVIDYTETLSEVLGFNEDTVFGNQTPLYFDACLKEIYPTLKFGATTHLIPTELFSMPLKLVEYLNEKRINTICWVVSALTMISNYKTFDTVKPEYLRTVAFGSEVFPIRQFNLWREALPDAEFFNLYGPTEGTGMCCYYHVDRAFGADEVIPIGRPFFNTDILLINEDGMEDTCGEMYIRGTSVTLGYYNDAEKTAENYVQNPLHNNYPETVYRTGDIGRLNARGELEFVTRKDSQIKHMGYRIEPGEIEINTNALEKIRFSCCFYDKKKGKIILCYEGDIEKGEVVTELKERLPRYMLPNKVIRLEQMIFTANGKIDRVTLQKRYEEGELR